MFKIDKDHLLHVYQYFQYHIEADTDANGGFLEKL